MSNIDYGSFRLYPRGFVGAKDTMTVKPTQSQREQNLQPLVYSLNQFKRVEEQIASNPDIDQLYQRIIGEHDVLKSFDFNEAVLLTAMRAFGTQSFLYWVRQQYLSPYVGETHRAFIDDTLYFIQTGHRKVNLNIWIAMLGEADVGALNPPLSPYVTQFFGLHITNPMDASLPNIISKWIAHPDGIEDLIVSTYLLFGKKDIK